MVTCNVEWVHAIHVLLPLRFTEVVILQAGAVGAKPCLQAGLIGKVFYQGASFNIGVYSGVYMG